MPSTHSIVMVALLPIPIKSRDIRQNWLVELWQTNPEVLNEVLLRSLQPLIVNTLAAPRVGIITFSVQMATSGIADQL
jgi:hypothetical protein